MENGGELIRNAYIDRLSKLKGNGMIKALTGIRNVGKTTILRQFGDNLVSEGMSEDSVICLDVESPYFAGVKGTDGMMEKIRAAAGDLGFYVLLLDEPERIEGWTAALYNLLQEGKCDIYITSSADLGPILKGSSIKDRVQEIRVDPLSLKEFMELNGLQDPVSACEAYVRIGGLPVVRTSMDGPLAAAVLRGTLADILFSSTLELGGGDDSERLRTLMNFIMAHLGQSMQMKDISDTVDRNQLFAEKYVRALTGNFAFFEQEDEGSKLLKSQSRYYVTDAGLRYCTAGAPSDWETCATGALYSELMRRGYSVRIDRDGDGISFVADTPKGKTWYSVSETYVPDGDSGKKFGFGLRGSKRTVRIVPRSELQNGGMDLSDLLLEKDLVS